MSAMGRKPTFKLRHYPASSQVDASWSFIAAVSPLLRTIQASLPGIKTLFAEGPSISTHDAAYREHVTRGFDWTSGDRVPANLLNQVMVTAPHFGLRSSGKDLPASSLARVPA